MKFRLKIDDGHFADRYGRVGCGCSLASGKPMTQQKLKLISLGVQYCVSIDAEDSLSDDEYRAEERY